MSNYHREWIKPTRFALTGIEGQAFDGYTDLNPDGEERSIYPLFPLSEVHRLIEATKGWNDNGELLRYDERADEVVVDLGFGGDKDDLFEKSIYRFSPVTVEGVGKLYAAGWDSDEWEEVKQNANNQI